MPYKGAGAVLADLMGGQVQMLITSLSTALPHIKSGKLRVLMVTSDKRSPQLPDVPSAPEAGLPKLDVPFWTGFAAPAGTPPAVVDRLNRVIAERLRAPEVRQRLAELGLEPIADSPADATRRVAAEMARWEAVIRERGIKAE